MSTSRSGAARSAAILLISCHISALSQSTSRTADDHVMTKHLQKQLKQQRHLLHLELPSSYSNRIIAKFGKNGIDLGYGGHNNDDDDDINSLDYGGSIEMGAVPTPASEKANVAVKRPFIYLENINIVFVYELKILCYFSELFLVMIFGL